MKTPRFLIFMAAAASLAGATTDSVSAAERRVVIDKPAYRLYVIEGSDTLMTAPVCLARNRGNKTRRGDHKTPEGTFKVASIENSSSWKHDFGDGRGKVAGAYGPWFIRLKVGVSPHIGIHGTCFPESMGKRESDGCIRLRNSDMERLKPLVKVGTSVTITPDR